MNEDEFKRIYRELKSIIEEIDPAGLGAEGEYDDVLFSIIRENRDLTEKEVFAQNIARVIAERFGLNKEDIIESSMELSEKVYENHPQGI